MSDAKKKPSAPKAAKAKTKPDAAVLDDAKARVMAQLEADQTVDSMPHGAQAGLFGGDWKAGLKKVVDKLLPVMLEAAILATPGPLTPAKIRKIVELAVKVIPDLVAAVPDDEPEGAVA